MKTRRNALLMLPNIEGIVALRTNTSTAHGRAIELGMGIGGLPTYIVALGSDLIPVDVGIKHQVDIWMTYHPDARSVRACRSSWIGSRRCSTPSAIPGSADEFIHPNELMRREPPSEPDVHTLLRTGSDQAARRAAGG